MEAVSSVLCYSGRAAATASTDVVSHRDPVLARALTLAGTPTDAAKAGALFPDKGSQ